MGNVREVSIIISFLAGILTFLSPCILPLFPSYIGYITGRSFKDITSESYSIKKETAMHSLFFILGFSIVFILFGVAVAYIGSFFGIKKVYLERIGAVVIILFGLHISGLLNINFLIREKRLTYHRKDISHFGSFLIGTVFALGWTPCAGPILSSILIYASTLQSLPRAIVLLSFYCLGLGVPFFLAGLAINQFLFIFNRFKFVMKFVPIVSGIFLIFVGVLLFLGRFAKISGIFTL